MCKHDMLCINRDGARECWCRKCGAGWWGG